MGAPRPAPSGFTIVELLVGILVGSIAMTMVMGLFVNSTEAIRFGNSQAMAVGAVEVAMQRLVRDIKAANTSNPDPATGYAALVPTSLPLLPYYGAEPFPYSAYAASSGALPLPALPAARLFTEQVSVTPLHQSRWGPNPELPEVPADASNSLVFFHNENGTVQRVTLRVDGPDLVRLVQSPVGAATLTDTAPVPSRLVIVRGVRSLQFTYPKLLSEVNGANGSTFDTALMAMSTSEREVYLNRNYRRLIGIRLRVAVKGPGGGRAAVTELRSTVEVRN